MVPRLLVACPVASALASCGSSLPTVASAKPSPSSQPTPDHDKEPGRVIQGSDHSNSIEVSDGVPGPHASIARAFIRFAMNPTTSSLERVPFDRSGIAISLAGTRKHLLAAEAADPEAWFLSDNGGTTSALFAIANTTRVQGADATRLLVSTRLPPVCAADNLDDPRGASRSAEVFITLLEPDTTLACAAGFRIGLDIGARNTIQVVRLAVRSP